MTTLLTKSEIRQRAFKGQANFMTPEFVSDHLNDDFYIELSSGTGMTGNTIYGVTVVALHPFERRNDLSKMCTTYREADNYIYSILNGESDE